MRNILLSIVFLVSGAAFAGDQTCEPEFRCECAQAVPFESWVIYIVERCGKAERWYLLEYRGTQYTDAAECTRAFDSVEECAGQPATSSPEGRRPMTPQE